MRQDRADSLNSSICEDSSTNHGCVLRRTIEAV